MKRASAIAAALLSGSALAQDVTSLRVADAAQHAAAQGNDGAKLVTMAHPDFRLFAPEGYIGDRARLTQRFKSAETGYTRFDRTIESASVTGMTGVVMGREVIQRRGEAVTPRRFTNIWIWQDGRWQWLARHAQVEAPKDGK